MNGKTPSKIGTCPTGHVPIRHVPMLVLFLFLFLLAVVHAGTLTADETAAIEAVKKVKPAVVGIKTYREDMSGSPLEVASGIIFRPDGYILTNAHVLRGAHHVIVYTAVGKQYEAALVAPANESDLAVLHINASRLPVVTFGDSDRLLLGQTAIAIGNPLSFGWTVTKGVVSALHRQVSIPNVHYKDLIQTDAAINLGNSGGPLVSTSGEIIGINTLIYENPTITTQGLGFAIPSNAVKRIAQELLHLGSPAAAFQKRTPAIKLGIGMYDLNDALATQLGLTIVKGVVIERIDPNSSAAKAKLLTGDVLSKVDGIEISGTEFLIHYVQSKSPGTVITFELWRRGIRESRNVKLEPASN